MKEFKEAAADHWNVFTCFHPERTMAGWNAFASGPLMLSTMLYFVIGIPADVIIFTFEPIARCHHAETTLRSRRRKERIATRRAP